jgi:LysM repeat protein
MTLIIPVSPAFDPRAIAATEQPTPRRGHSRSGRGGATWHVVRRGDSWWSIANQNGVSLSDLLDLNDAGSRDRLRIGQRIRVRPGSAGALGRVPSRVASTATPRTYRVRRGDTLSGIAVRFGLAESDLRRTNQLSGGANLPAGRVLHLR